jgi:F0F1-type ATP synthase assembly protein I
MDRNQPDDRQIQGNSVQPKPSSAAVQSGIPAFAWKTVGVQAVCLAALLAASCAASQAWPPSLLAGGLAALLPAILSAAVNGFRAPASDDPAAFLKRYFAAEALKLSSSVSCLVAAFNVPGLLPTAILAGFFAVLVAGWIGLATLGLTKVRHGT